jgi:hypothetical protein
MRCLRCESGNSNAIRLCIERRIPRSYVVPGAGLTRSYEPSSVGDAARHSLGRHSLRTPPIPSHCSATLLVI